MSSYVVRYGSMRALGVMSARGDVEFRRGAEVICRSERGLEIGQVLCAATEDALSHLDQPEHGQIVREVSSEDISEASRIDSTRLGMLERVQKAIDSLGLQMNLVDVEQLFGGERIVVFYLAEDRVDFRELVKKLASEFQTRIEMKQIGVRDEAKLLADYGDCGKPVCCNNHLTTMPPVSMRMAKLQKATLDPTKISGRCGRLKCCLRYEFENYDQIQKSLPRIGSRIVTRNGKAKVLRHEILAEQLLVETEDHRRMLIDASEVLSVLEKAKSDKGGSGDKHKKNRQSGAGNQSGKSRKPSSARKSSTKHNPDDKRQGGKKRS